MSVSSKVIPKTQAFTIIGGVTVLVLCACVLLASWRLDDRDLLAGEPAAGANPAGAPVTEPISIAEPGSTSVTTAPGAAQASGAGQVDNGTLLRRLGQCRPECAGVDLILPGKEPG